MPEGKQPEPGNWKKDLDRNFNPGLDKEEVWNSLQARLLPEKSKRRLAWYRVAAAILVLLLGGWFLFPRPMDHSGPAVKNQNRFPAPDQISGKSFVQVQAVPQRPTPFLPNEKKPGHFPQKTGSPQQSRQIDMPGRDTLLPAATTSMNIPANPPQDSLLAAIKPKPALSVVHLNEIGDEPTEVPSNSNAGVLHGFSVRMNAEPGSENHSVADRRPGTSLFKIRISPQN